MNVLRSIRTLIVTVLLLASAPATADALDEILERGTLRIGVSLFTPWALETADGELIGYEIDVGKKLAQDMGVRAEFKVVPWEKIIAALQDGDIDVIAGGMAITPQRALQVNFSRPLAQSGVGIALNTSKTRNVKTLDGLNRPDIVIATAADSLAASVSKTLFDRANVRVYATSTEAEASLLDGQAHGYLASMPEVVFLQLNNASKVDLPMSEPLVASSEALAVRRGEQQLLNFFDAWVTARRSDKWLQSTRDYWFGTLDWVPEEDEQ